MHERCKGIMVRRPKSLYFQPDGTTRCDKVGPVGCIYKEVLEAAQPRDYDKFIVTTTKNEPDVTECLIGCRAMFPDSFFAAIRKSSSTEMECFCLRPNAFNASTLGPDVNCNQVSDFSIIDGCLTLESSLLMMGAF